MIFMQKPPLFSYFMAMRFPLLFIAFYASLCFSEAIFNETPISNHYNCPSPASVISHTGDYFINDTLSKGFEVIDTRTGEYVFRSRFSSWIPPYPEHRDPTITRFVFSPDDAMLVTDNYFFNGKDNGPEKNWVEVWDIKRSRVIQQFRSFLERFDPPYRFEYNVRASLSHCYNRRPFKCYVNGPKVVFDQNGGRVFLLFPSPRIFTLPNFTEVSGEGQFAGVSPLSTGGYSFSDIGTPLLLNDGGTILPIRGRLLLFGNFPSNMENYTKMEIASPDNIEISPAKDFIIVNGNIYRYGFLNSMSSFNGQAFFSDDGAKIMCGSSIFGGSAGFYAQSPYFLDASMAIPSSDRKYIFTTESIGRKFNVYSFSSGELLQTIHLTANESLLRNTDDGRMLIFRDDFTGQIRIFEKQ
jgi:hypothetical protein